jgi:hypothetical protein
LASISSSSFKDIVFTLSLDNTDQSKV